jgi:ubiquitin-activating enzyme E1
VQYYLKPSTVGTPRAAACVNALMELNPYVQVQLAEGQALTEELVGRFHCVVMTGASRAEQLRWNAFCRSRAPAPIGFIAADVMGAAGFCFVDFGDEHIVRDASGENKSTAVVMNVDRGKTTIVYTPDTKRHTIEEGMFVSFREIEGMVELNDGKARKVIATTPYSFTLEEDSSAFGEYTGSGGMAEQVKLPYPMAFASLADRLLAPAPPGASELINADYSKWGRPEQLHVAFSAVEAFREKHGRLPQARNWAEATECVQLAKDFAGRAKAAERGLQVEEVDDTVVRNLAILAQFELPALNAFFGGVAAQEVVKLTGKFTPLHQWLFLDAFECVPNEALTEESTSAAALQGEHAPANGRYDNVIGIFGRTLQTKISNQRVFVVGAGALGCEFLKNFALMGVGCGPNGHVTVTDMDRIEVSNLNRQFLFRSWDVGNPKSATAAAAAKVMNPDLKVDAMEIAVGEDTESTFDDAFWERLDFVTNALDNLKARQYVDARCVFYCKPLLESGTLGTKANTQVVMPFKTETYSDSQDPPEESIPMCTLRNFPHAIEHCIEWARDLFAGAFTNSVQDAAAFTKSPKDWLRLAAEEAAPSSRRTKLEGVRNTLTTAKVADVAHCVSSARLLFHQHFDVAIRQLLHNFPADYVDKNGVKFWSGTKRVPTAAEFDPSNPTHMGFIVHATGLYASNYGIALPANWNTPEVLLPMLSHVEVPPFAPKVVVVKTDERDNTTMEGAEDDRDVVARLTAELTAIAEGQASDLVPASGLDSIALFPAEFEKDDDSNHHIDFITQASNLRAGNYKIKEATRYEVKMTAGKIIPAIATTTCMVTGLVCIEAYKLMAGKPLEDIRNSFVNVAVNVFSMGEPGGPKRTKSQEFDPIACGPVRALPEGFTRWDKIVIKGLGNMTPVQLEDWMQKEQGLDVLMVSTGRYTVYNPMLFPAHRTSRGGVPIRTILEDIIKMGKVTRPYIMLDISASDADGDVLIPPVQLYWQ